MLYCFKYILRRSTAITDFERNALKNSGGQSVNLNNDAKNSVFDDNTSKSSLFNVEFDKNIPIEDYSVEQLKVFLEANEDKKELLQAEAMEQSKNIIGIIDEAESNINSLYEEILKLYENYEDDVEHSYDVAVSDYYDDYGREIIVPVFENILRMSDNATKYVYSKIKNALLIYKDTKQVYCDKVESFFVGENLVATMCFDKQRSLVIGFANYNNSLVKKLGATSLLKDTPLLTNNLTKKENYESVMFKIKDMALLFSWEEKDVYSYVCYAERYMFDKELVLLGDERIAPELDKYDLDSYQPIDNENTFDINTLFSKGEKEEVKREELLRQEALSLEGADAINDPYVFFYDPSVDEKSEVKLINMQLLLNDKFLGKLVDEHYRALAESVGKIEIFDKLCLEKVIEDASFMPEFMFCVNVSCKWLIDEAKLSRLLDMAKTANKNLILAFDCVLLGALGKVGVKAIDILRNSDIKICVNNIENATIDFLSEFAVDYYKFDGRRYKREDMTRWAQMEMIVNFAKAIKVTTVVENIDKEKMVQQFLKRGVDMVGGNFMGYPKRVALVAVQEYKRFS